MAKKAAAAKKLSRSGDSALTLRDIGSRGDDHDPDRSVEEGSQGTDKRTRHLQVKKRATRKGRNPATGESIKIKASKRVAFAASRDLKASL
jgi:hypothetical protein